MAEPRLVPLPAKLGFTGLAGLVAILLAMLVLPGTVVNSNLSKPETKRLVIELERQMFTAELTEQDASDTGRMKAEIGWIASAYQADTGASASTAVRKQINALNEQTSKWQGVLWLAMLALTVCFFLIVSLRITGKPFGLLVNERNVMSLSRFQTVLWTVVLLSAYYTAASLRIYGLHDAGGALNIGMDWHLWALMGISFTSLVVTPLIHTVKQGKTLSVDEAAKLPSADVAGSDGILYANPNFSDAAWTDMFEGDEVKNAYYVDIAKLQMFGSIPPEGFAEFPPVSEGFLTILGLSHAGYLASKSVDRTKNGGNG
ncbi:hypothetical protein [Paenibacillus tyrfis]|uniref:hypothetical protein n=1 Tax=Paenibacillus tyrfis TaxID=1501230 RepID=UPI000B58D6BD|nr:hypothetical protein [Paenibacillus tyrfis]